MNPDEISSLQEVLQYRARQTPDQLAFTYLDGGEHEQARLTYRDLDRRARAVAHAMRSRGVSGLRALLLFAPGIDFVVALFGCFYAGVTAVPAYPPDPFRPDRTLPRLTAIIKDSAPAVILTTSDLIQMAPAALQHAPELRTLEWIPVDEQHATGGSTTATVEPDDLAFIQYTSGSTATPKGVMVTHENALANMKMIKTRAGQDATRVIACWVPFYHDMGLLCGVLVPPFIGASAILMSPLDFLQRPVTWFRAISKYRVTDTCAPNFALDLCVKRITSEQRRALDLSSLKVFVISAEPLRASSLQRFLDTFTPSGLSPSCIVPAYGLAEAVLGVTCAAPGTHTSVVHLDPDELQQNRWREVDPAKGRVRSLIRCGTSMPGVDVEIVDPELRTGCAPGQIGEIWVRGPNVALGYWNRVAETRETFGARREDTGDEPFLRTGDLGYLKDGELYVTGRVKDLVIIRGMNHYPQDIESTVERCHPAVRAGCAIAFSIDAAGMEHLVVVAEIDRSRLGDARDETSALQDVVRAIRLAVSAEHGVQVYDVARIKQRTIDKTSSGKLARRACKKRYLDGSLEPELPHRTGPLPTTLELQAISSRPSSAREPQSAGPTIAERIAHAAPEGRRELLTAYVKQQLVKVLGPEAEHMMEAGSSAALGLDSLAVLELAGRVDKDFGIALPLARLHELVSVPWLVDHLLEHMPPGGGKTRPQSVWPRKPRGQLAVPLQPPAIRRPFFCVTGTLGIPLHLRHLARTLGREQPFFALQAPGLTGDEPPLHTVEALAQRYIEEIRAVQPRGPYVIGGYSFGGLVAYEMAQRLSAQGERVLRLLLLDSVTVAPEDRAPPQTEASIGVFELLFVLRGFRGESQRGQSPSADEIARMDATQWRALLHNELEAMGSSPQESQVNTILDVHGASLAAMRSYRPRPYHGSVTLLRAEEGMPAGLVHPSRELRIQSHDPTLGWAELCSNLRVVDVGGDHLTMVRDPHVLGLGAAIRTEIGNSGSIEIDLSALASAGGDPPSAEAIEAATGPRSGALFNPFHPDFIADPYPMLARLRTEDPVHWSGMSLWCISRYKDVVTGLRDKRFSVDSRHWVSRSSRSKRDGQGRVSVSALSAWNRDENSPQARVYNNIMVTLDAPRHTRLRRLLSPVFEPSAIKQWRAFAQEIVDTLLKTALSRGDIDIIRDLALPLPSMFISRLLGLPVEDLPMLQKWASDLTRALDPLMASEIFHRADRVVEEFEVYLRRHIESTRSAPRGELLSLMVAAEADGERLTMEELIANCIFLFIAGFESTTGAIGNGVLALLRNPDQMRLLQARPEIIEGAVEELLRYDGSVRSVFRTALEDVDMGGKLIRAGDYVLFLLPAANRDPEEFPDPDRLDLTRKCRHHVAFGHGIHYCLGAPLTRLEIQAAIGTVVRVMPQMKLVPGGLRWRNSLSMRALDSLPVTPE